MARLKKMFNTENVNGRMNSVEPAPAGKYKMMIVKSEEKVTRKKNGKYFKFEMNIIDGPYKGRKVFHNVHSENPNPVAVEIGEKELATIIEACGKSQIVDTVELHNIPFVGQIKIEPANKDYAATNKMVYFKSLKGQKVSSHAATDKTPPPDALDDVPW